MPKWAFFLANTCVYHGKNKIWGDDDGDVHFVLDQNTELDFYCATMYLTETTVCGYTCHSTRTHYHDSEPINLSPYKAGAWQRSNKYQFYSHWFAPKGAQAHDLQAH